MVHQLRQEKRLGGVLVDLGRVPFVVFPRRSGRNWRRGFGGFLGGGRKRQGQKEADCDSAHDLDDHIEAGDGDRGWRLRYRQLPLLAFGTARNVMLAGANVTRPDGVGTPASRGNSSLALNRSSFPFRSTRVSSRFRAVSV